jgi:hypothetical protein
MTEYEIHTQGDFSDKDIYVPETRSLVLYFYSYTETDVSVVCAT